MRRMRRGPRLEEDRDVDYKETYFRLLGFAKPYLSLIIIVLVLALIGSFVGIIPDQIMGVAVDRIFNYAQMSEQVEETALPDTGIDDPEPPTTPEQQFARALPVTPYVDRITDFITERWLENITPALGEALVLALIFMFLYIFSRGLNIIQGILTVYIGQSLIYDVRKKVYDHLQRLSFKYFENNRTGDVMARVVNDVDSLADVIVGPVIEVVTNVSGLIFVLYFCLIWDWKLTLMALIAVPILILVTKYFGTKLRINFRKLRRRIGDLNGLLQDNISGIRVIKAFSREEHEFERFDEKNQKNFESRLKLGILFRVFRPIINFLNQIGTLVVLCFGSLQVYRGLISPGIFVTFFRYLPRLYNPITGFSRFYHQIQRALASSERVFEVLDTEPEIEDIPDAIELKEVEGHVEFEHVNFSYDEESQVLQDINLEAQPGEMIAFVGPSGAGKTTLTNLIPRFYDPTEGSILIDGHNLKKIKAKILRKNIGIVQQDPFLFNDSIKNNISYGNLQASEEEIKKAAKAANCHQFIKDFSEGYETQIGERGVKLSGGQKQRVSIARAILADPKILILDEATSSVDTETEILIQKAIDNLVKNRTTFVIAHRLSTIQGADMIVVMDKGQIVETGNHQDLIEKEGLYRKLHDMQFYATLKNREGNEAQESMLDNSSGGFPGLEDDDIFGNK